MSFKPVDITRCRLLTIPSETIVHLLSEWHRLDFICLPRLSLPDDHVVVSSYHDMDRQSITFRIASAEYDNVALGCCPPYISFDDEIINISKLVEKKT